MCGDLRKIVRNNSIISMAGADEGVNAAIGGCAAMVNTASRLGVRFSTAQRTFHLVQLTFGRKSASECHRVCFRCVQSAPEMPVNGLEACKPRGGDLDGAERLRQHGRQRRSELEAPALARASFSGAGAGGGFQFCSPLLRRAECHIHGAAAEFPTAADHAANGYNLSGRAAGAVSCAERQGRTRCRADPRAGWQFVGR